MFRRMGIRSFDLHEAFRAYRLITTSSPIQVGGIVEKTDGAFGGIFVKKSFDWSTAKRGRRWDVDLLRR